MSLDVSLYAQQSGPGGSGIFVRENGSNHEISRAEWDEKFPGREPVVAKPDANYPIFDANITHNLNKMADEAGIYGVLWRPDENDITKAEQLIEPLRAGLARLEAEPDRFRAFNPSNGWGDYSVLVEFVRRYLRACEEWPDATVEVSR